MKKLGLVLIALVIALGAMGVGYAAWAQNLTITNNVETGYISASFFDASVGTDEYADLEYKIKSDDNRDANGRLLKDVLEVDITDAYPGFNQTIWFRVINNGTVPFYLTPGKVVVNDGVNNVKNIITVTTDGIDSGDVVEPGQTSAWHSYFLNVPGKMSQGYVDPAQKHTYTVTIPLVATQSMVPEPTGTPTGN